MKTVMKGKESLVEDKLSLLNSNWIAVTSRTEEWFNLLLVRKMRLCPHGWYWHLVVSVHPHMIAFSGAIEYAYLIHWYKDNQVFVLFFLVRCIYLRSDSLQREGELCEVLFVSTSHSCLLEWFLDCFSFFFFSWWIKYVFLFLCLFLPTTLNMNRIKEVLKSVKLSLGIDTNSYGCVWWH